MRFVWALFAAAGCRFDLPAGEMDTDLLQGIHTAPILPAICTTGTPGVPTCPFNFISLDDLGEGAGIPGAMITFVAQAVGSGLYLNKLRLVPGPMGAHIEHPLFITVPPDPRKPSIPDRLDRYINLRMSLPSTATTDEQQIGGGTAAFVDFAPANQIVIAFEVARVL